MRQAARVLAVALAAVLAGCGGTAATGTTGSTASSAAAGGSPAATAGTGTASSCGMGMQITVKGSTVTPPPGTTDVRAGCLVDLTITADRTTVVHVHVIDLEKPITAGKPLHVTFTPTQQGVYEVELHDPDLLLVKLAVR